MNKAYKLSEAILFNPVERLTKGMHCKKVPMECLCPFTRHISSYEDNAVYTGGSKFRNGDTLLARITPCLENGKTAKVNFLNDNEVAFGSTEFIVLRAKPDVTDENFIYYLAISPEFRKIAIKSMVGSSGRQRVQQNVLENIIFEIPELSKQKKIGKILSLLDDKIELNTKINQNLEAQAQAIFKSWFVDFEPFQNGKFVDSELGPIPEGWQVVPLDQIADFLNGLPMQKYRPVSNEIGLPVLKIKELREGICSEDSERCTEDIKPEYIVDDGDVIFSWSGSLMIDIWTGGRCGLNQHLFKVTSKDYEKWFYYLWICHHMENFIAIAADKATTMGHIQRGHIHAALTLVPSKQVYNELSSILSPIINKLIQSRIESQRLAKLRDNLLPKLMSGEIDVSEIEV